MAVYKVKPLENGGGSGATYTAGNGIEITDENVINNTQDVVVANPELVGTEDNLTGIQVGDTKYKVPQGGSSSLGLKYQDTKDVVDFVWVDIDSKLNDTAEAIYLDTSKLKQILIKAGVDLNQPFDDAESPGEGMERVNLCLF